MAPVEQPGDAGLGAPAAAVASLWAVPGGAGCSPPPPVRCCCRLPPRFRHGPTRP